MEERSPSTPKVEHCAGGVKVVVKGASMLRVADMVQTTNRQQLKNMKSFDREKLSNVIENCQRLLYKGRTAWTADDPSLGVVALVIRQSRPYSFKISLERCKEY